MTSRSLPAVVLAAAALLQPASAVALPRGATTPTPNWLVGTWVFKGAKCSDSANVHLADGRMGSTGPGNTISILGRYSLRGNVLTEIVESKQYGDLTNVTRIGAMGANELVSEPLNNRDPNVFILPQRRCPEQPGVEPWFPRIRFQGMAAYGVLPVRSAGGPRTAPRATPPTAASAVSGLQGTALAQMLVGNWEVTSPDSDPGRCMSPPGEVEFEMAKFKADGRYEFIGQDGGGSGRWSLTGRTLRETFNGKTYTSSIRVISRDHFVVRYTQANGGEMRYRRCPW